jgi:hypothetical protein
MHSAKGYPKYDQIPGMEAHTEGTHTAASCTLAGIRHSPASSVQNGKTEYKSVTIAPDTSAEEFMDMYFDDEFRPKWVSHGPLRHSTWSHPDCPS